MRVLKQMDARDQSEFEDDEVMSEKRKEKQRVSLSAKMDASSLSSPKKPAEQFSGDEAMID